MIPGVIQGIKKYGIFVRLAIWDFDRSVLGEYFIIVNLKIALEKCWVVLPFKKHDLGYQIFFLLYTVSVQCTGIYIRGDD